MSLATLQTISNIAILVGTIVAALGAYGHFRYGEKIEAEKHRTAITQAEQLRWKHSLTDLYPLFEHARMDVNRVAEIMNDPSTTSDSIPQLQQRVNAALKSLRVLDVYLGNNRHELNPDIAKSGNRFLNAARLYLESIALDYGKMERSLEDITKDQREKAKELYDAIQEFQRRFPAQAEE